MSANPKRRRERVSYKEPSSDEDFSKDSDHVPSPKKKRAVPQRRSARHQLSDSERASTARPRQNAFATEAAPASRLRHAKLRGRQKVSYRESSTDDNSDADFDVQEATPARDRQRARVAGSTRHTRIKKSRSKPLKGLGAPLKTRPTPQQGTAPPRKITTDGNIPPWATLPYHVLLQIFVYASHPLHDDNLTPTSSICWLARTARLCTAFTKPALTALYRNPPIFAVRQNRKELVKHLISQPLGAHEDYPVMVKRLQLDATRMTKLTDLSSSVLDLAALIASLTTLREIDIFDPFDKPPYRERSRRIRRWYYPDELFAALGQSELRLQSWRWNSTYCARGILWMKDIHTSRAFRSLREISLAKFHSASPRKGEEDDSGPTIEELLGSALAVLPNLKSLTFETCNAVNERLLPLLPHNLVSLNITNCRGLTSTALQGFLVTHGAQLEELILNHNQTMDLSFLVDLRQCCPRLEVLRMDMHYYNTLSTSSDNEPLYDELLPEGEIPSWPSTLRIVDLEFLRNWSANAAVAFFTSLIDAAGELPWLRELTVTAIVDVDWRQRAEFRKKWTARFQKVFARRQTTPDVNLVSLRAFREWKASHQAVTVEENGSFVDGEADDVKKDEIIECDSDSDSDSDTPLLPLRKHKGTERWNSERLRSRAKSPNYDQTSGTESGPDYESDAENVKLIQGLCHTVLFRIDNSRPQEQIYDEEDFLDAEASGDEDWNGNDVDEDAIYAW